MSERLAPLPPLPGVRTRVPSATIVLLTAWAICTALYHLGVEKLFLAVRRDPEALASGQVWRVISPVLVQPDSVFAVVVLGVCAAWLGVVAERAFGTGRFAVLLLAGGLAGHVIGEWWQPYSGGVSVAFCGPVGAVAVYVLVARIRKHFAAAWFVLGGAVLLSVLTDIHGPAILAGAAVGFVLCRPAERVQPDSSRAPSP